MNLSLVVYFCVYKMISLQYALSTGRMAFLRLESSAWTLHRPLAILSLSQKKRMLMCLLAGWSDGSAIRYHRQGTFIVLLNCNVRTCIPWHFTMFSTLIAGVAPSLAATNSDSALDLVFIGCFVDIAFIAPLPNVMYIPVCPL